MERIKSIDYLKTIAIIGVLLFHVGLISNGYLGVEVFFVISGFLMMTKIKKSIDDKTFNPIKYIFSRLAAFWPLVAVAGVISMIIGYFIMIPDDYENLAQSVIASDAFSNNILQAITTKDYWNIVNTYKPLMQTWYVGVLFQSIIFLALFVWIMSKISKKSVKLSLIVVTVISFIAYCLPFFEKSDKFYFFPFRLFEITAGCLLTYLPESKLPKKVNRILGYLGLLGIILALFAGFNIPGNARQIATIVFTCLVIRGHGSINEEYKIGDKVYKIITLPGKYSYDVYIWHQVVIAFLYYAIFRKLSFGMVCAVVACTALLAFISVAARKKIPLLNGVIKRNLFALAIVVIGCGASMYVYIRAGVVRDVPELGIDSSNVHRHMHAEYCDIPYSWDKDFVDPDKIHVFVFGDSFARDFANILNESEYSDKLEISYLFGDDPSSQEDRIEQADFVFFGSNSWDEPAGLELIPAEKLYRVGNKRFGTLNGLIFVNRNKDWYFDQMVEVSDDMVRNNNSMIEKYGDHYIDMLTPVMENGSVRVFTDDNYYISQDCAHLTRFGAMYYARILDLSFITK